MPKCYLCDDSITEQNQSLEHIIPNSIGGRLKSKSLICASCNKTTGNLFDDEFAKFGNILASKYNIKKEKGIVQPIQAKDISTGEKLAVMPGYKLNLTEPKSSVTDSFISVLHYDKKRAIEELKRLSKQLDGTEACEKNIQFEIIEDNTKKDFLIDLPIEPNLLLRSVTKTIVNLYLHKTEDYRNCQPIINFLKEDIENRFCWFLDLGISTAKHNKSPYHIAIIRGDKKSRMLYAYFEIFGEAGFLALLNGQYKGIDLQINYTFDPINCIEIEYEYDFLLTPNEIIQHLIVKPESEMVKCFYH